MDGVSASPALSNCSQFKLASDAQSSTLDSAIRNKRIALQIIDKASYAKDPLSWTCDTPQKYWKGSPTSSKYIMEYKRRTEKEKGKDQPTRSKSKRTKSKRRMKSSSKVDDGKQKVSALPSAVVSVALSSLLSGLESSPIPIQSLSSKSIMKSIANTPYGMLESDLDESNYACTATPSNCINEEEDYRLPENIMPMEGLMDEIPKLSIIPHSKGGTAWLKTGNYIDSSSVTFSPYMVKDGSTVNEVQNQQVDNQSEQSAGSYVSDKVENIEPVKTNKYATKEQRKKSGYKCLSSGLSPGVGYEDGAAYSTNKKQQYPPPFQQQSQYPIEIEQFDYQALPSQSNKRDFSRGSNFKFPSRNEGYFKPLSDFMDFKFEERIITFSDEELELIRKLDYILAYKFCYRGFNIILMILMGLCLTSIILVPTLYGIGKLPKTIEFIHMMFFALVIMFILFVINLCASKEVRIEGHYVVRSYVRIYWHLFRKKVDKNFNISYMFLDDWYGDDKYKFLKAKLHEISQIEEEISNDLDNEMELEMEEIN